jgi:putative ABC transport system permease protein
MFTNYLKVAWRNLLRTKGYSAINIGGLAVGLTISMLIGFWLFDELTYNSYHSSHEKIGKVMTGGSFGGQRWVSDAVQRPLELVLRKDYGNNFKQIVLSRWDEEHILSIGDNKFSRTGRFMQEGAPDLLSLRMVHGSRDGLRDQFSIMLAESVASALFRDENPIGRIIRLDNKTSVKVTGVYEDIPYNSEFRETKFLCPFSLVASLTPWMQEAATSWANSSFIIYVQVADGKSIEQASHAVNKAVYNNVPEDQKKYNFHTFLFPMKRWHLYSEWRDGVNVGGRIQFVWLFAIIGVFVLLLACINFMNLSTARSEKRAKEVGIRKAIGSLRNQLIRQFFTESFLVVIVSFLFAMFLVVLFLPFFNEVADKQMKMMWNNPYFWMLSALFVIVTSLVAGSYPALYLSSFNPVKVLKGTFQAGSQASLPRRILVVLQFTVSVALIIGTIIVYRQIEHAKNRPVGYDRNGLMLVQIKSDDLRDKAGALEKELKDAGIASEMAMSSSPVTEIWANNGGFEWRGKRPDQLDGFGVIYVTHDYGKTVGWNFREGRDFSREFALDSATYESPKEPTYSVVINEAAARYMNFDKPLGEIVSLNDYKFRIIGVIRDMVMESPYEPVRHIMYFVNYAEAGSYINIRLNPAIGASQAIARMEKIFTRIVPAVPFDYRFADAAYAQKFASEERIGKLAGLFASLAILISCLGLFGLASFVAEKRTKEIGIRKVLGATVANLWAMLSKEFVLLILLACLIAVPVSYYLLHQWLQQYEYRTNMSWWIFVLAIIGSVFITILTVSFQAIRAALSNPVKSLRSE